MKKRFFALFLTMALLLPAVLLSGCASADSGIMDSITMTVSNTESIRFLSVMFVFISLLLYTHLAIAAERICGETGF